MAKRQKATRLPKHVRAHGSGFRAVIQQDGKRIRSRTFATVEDAQKWLAIVLPVRDQARVAAGAFTLADGLARILEHLSDTDASDGTRSFYSTHSRTLFAGLGGGDLRVDMLTPAQVRDYVRKRRESGVSAATVVTKELGILRRIVKLAKDSGIPLPVDCFAGVKLPKVQVQRFGYLLQSDVADAVATMRKDRRGQGVFWADVVELLFATGIRRAELVRLRVKDIDIAKGHIFISGKMRDRHQTFGRSLVPILERLIAAAQRDGRIVRNRDAVIWAFTTWRRKLKLAEFSPHVLRHSYGTALAECVSSWQLMGLMGHEHLKQTSRYYHARGDDVRAALDSLQLNPPTEQQPGDSPQAGPE